MARLQPFFPRAMVSRASMWTCPLLWRAFSSLPLPFARRRWGSGSRAMNAADWVIEPVDVSGDGVFRPADGLPCDRPDQLRLDGLEECSRPSSCRSSFRARSWRSGHRVGGAAPDSRQSSIAIRGRNGEPVRALVASHESTAQGFDARSRFRRSLVAQPTTRREKRSKTTRVEPALSRPSLPSSRHRSKRRWRRRCLPPLPVRPSAVKSCATRLGASGQACSLSVVRFEPALLSRDQRFSRIRRAVRCRPISWPLIDEGRGACGDCHRSRLTARKPCGYGPDRPCPAAGADKLAVLARRRNRSG